MKPGTRILIVEDDRSITRLIQLEFEHHNLKVRCAYDGPSSLEAASEFEPAVIVLDIMLPGMDGVGVLKELRRRGNRAPVIVLTARDAPADKVHSLDMGADDYLTKPFDTEELMARCVPYYVGWRETRCSGWRTWRSTRRPGRSGAASVGWTT